MQERTTAAGKHWGLREGFLICGGLILAGLLLQLVLGPVKWDVFVWPVSSCAFVVLVVLIGLMAFLRKRVYAFRFFTTSRAAIPALACAVVLTVAMGLIRQNPDGTWLHAMLSFWPFVLIYLYIDVILGLTIVRRLTIRNKSFLSKIPFLLNHFGLFLAMTAATLGNADVQRLRMIAVVGEPEWRAVKDDGTVRKMPLTIELKRFIMETYPDGSPKRFASELDVVTRSGETVHATVDVNKPVEVEGWKIYQISYDTSQGAQSDYSILELVRDPWLPVVYAGIYMMLAGAVCMLW